MVELIMDVCLYTGEFLRGSNFRGFHGYYVIIYMKGREPEWPNPKLNVGNCLKSSKMD